MDLGHQAQFAHQIREADLNTHLALKGEGSDESYEEYLLNKIKNQDRKRDGIRLSAKESVEVQRAHEIEKKQLKASTFKAYLIVAVILLTTYVTVCTAYGLSTRNQTVKDAADILYNMVDGSKSETIANDILNENEDGLYLGAMFQQQEDKE